MSLKNKLIHLLAYPAPKTDAPGKKDYLIASLCALTSFLIFTPFMFVGLDFIHDGVLLATAYALNKGAVLYRDVFSQYGPLTAYIHLLSFKLFGVSFISMQYITLFFYLLISFSFYLLARFYLSEFEALLAYFLWLLSAYFLSWIALPWSSAYSLAFTLLAAFFAVYALSKKSSYYFLTGFFISLAFWTKQSVGIAFFLSQFFFILLYLTFAKKKERKFYLYSLVYFLAGATIPSVGYILYLIKVSALADMWQDMFIFMFNWGQRNSSNYSLVATVTNLFPHYYSYLYTFLYLFRTSIQLITIVILTLIALSNKKTQTLKIFILAFIAMLSPIILVPSLRSSLEALISEQEFLLLLAIGNVIAMSVFILKLTIVKGKIFNNKNAKLILLLFLSWAAWSQFHPYNDEVHTFYSIPLMLILGSFEISWLLNKIIPRFINKTNSHLLIQNLFFLLFMMAFFIPAQYPRLYKTFHKVLSIPKMRIIQQPPILKGMIETPENTYAIEKLADALYKAKRQRPQSNIEIFGDAPMVLTFLPDNHFPKLFADLDDNKNSIDIQNRTFPGYMNEKLAEIRKDKPIIVITHIYFPYTADYAKKLNYKVVFTEPITQHSILLPADTQ